MQLATPKFTIDDLAKYPFLKKATQHIRKLDLEIEDVTDPELIAILKRAQERVEEALLDLRVTKNLRKPDIEISSFPVAILIATATENTFIKKRYALAEAKQATNDMEPEQKEKILEIAKNFNWNITKNSNPTIPYEFALHFSDYVRNTTNLRETKWKLVNRPLTSGNVYLNQNDVIRLLQEEIRKYIEKRLETEELPRLPAKIKEIAQNIRQLSFEKIGKTEMEGFPKEIVQAAFPPCIKALYEAVASGRHLSHIGRFTLTTFLINIGMPTETIISLFKNSADFNERMTRYQVEHLAGEKGSRTRYIPPKCETLKTHSVCANPDETCQRISHALACYRRKLGQTK